VLRCTHLRVGRIDLPQRRHTFRRNISTAGYTDDAHLSGHVPCVRSRFLLATLVGRAVRCDDLADAETMTRILNALATGRSASYEGKPAACLIKPEIQRIAEMAINVATVIRDGSRASIP